MAVWVSNHHYNNINIIIQYYYVPTILGMFSLPTLLLRLVSGMGLLTLTATIIDTIILYLLPPTVYDTAEDIKTYRNKKTQ